MKVTIFKNVYDKTNPHHIALETALQRIQTGKSSTLVSNVRNGDKEKKKELPVVCFSGEFSSRADDALFEHSGFIVLDFDHVDVDSTKAALGMDDFIHSCWTSPSGNGIKALVHITNPERHRDHFRALVKYFEKQHGLEVDESGVNESRACYESHDPDIIIKDDFKKFERLYLSSNKITDAGAATIIAAIDAGGIPMLESVTLGNNSIASARHRDVESAIQRRYG